MRGVSFENDNYLPAIRTWGFDILEFVKLFISMNKWLEGWLTRKSVVDANEVCPLVEKENTALPFCHLIYIYCRTAVDGLRQADILPNLRSGRPGLRDSFV